MNAQNLVEINLHGLLEKHLGRKTWKYSAKTVGACLNAVEILSGRKLYKFLHENDAKGVKYQVLINGREFISEKPLDPDNLDTIKNSELVMKIGNLKTIDIIPVLEGSGGNGASIGSLILGIVLIILGIVFIEIPGLGVALIIGGLGLVAAGIINLLSKGPELQEFQRRQKTSYLFNGPTNTISEGAPVPVGYGTLLIGSAPISASYNIEQFDTGHNSKQNVNSKSFNKTE